MGLYDPESLEDPGNVDPLGVELGNLLEGA